MKALYYILLHASINYTREELNIIFAFVVHLINSYD